MTDLLRAPYEAAHGQCAAWDGCELVCDLPPGHAPFRPNGLDHRGHPMVNGRGFALVAWGADVEPVRIVEDRDRPAVPPR